MWAMQAGSTLQSRHDIYQVQTCCHNIAAEQAEAERQPALTCCLNNYAPCFAGMQISGTWLCAAASASADHKLATACGPGRTVLQA